MLSWTLPAALSTYIAHLQFMADRRLRDLFPLVFHGLLFTTETRRYTCLTKDCLTPVAQQMVLGDMPGFFAPWIARHDRGKALEQAWSVNLKGALDHPFSDLRMSEQKGTLPSLVFTPMMIEDGRRLLISNLDLRNVLTNDGSLLGQDKTI